MNDLTNFKAILRIACICQLDFLSPHLIEVCINILSTALVQLYTSDLLSEAGDADDIRRPKVLSEKITACFGHILHLIPCRREQTRRKKLVNPEIWRDYYSKSGNLLSVTHDDHSYMRLPHCSQKNMQDTLLSHGDVGSVGKVNEPSHHLGADVTQGDLRGTTLFEAAGEHGSEVRATRCQYHSVHLKKYYFKR